MTLRFSAESFEQPQDPVSEGAALSSSCGEGELPVAGCEVLTRNAPAVQATSGADVVDGYEVYVPVQYEANYAYPLIAWLTQPGRTTGRLQPLMRSISERNYFGVSLPVADPESIDDQLFEMFLRLRRRYHLHTERVYLLGFGESGTLALKAGLNRPDWFAGVAAISARCPDSPRLLARFHELRGKRMFLGIDENASAPIVADNLYLQRLFLCAGMHVSAVASSAGDDGRRGLFREIDRWVMQAIEQPELVC